MCSSGSSNDCAMSSSELSDADNSGCESTSGSVSGADIPGLESISGSEVIHPVRRIELLLGDR